MLTPKSLRLCRRHCFTGLLPLLSRLLILGQIAALILLTERPARAYADPGSGLLVFQMLGASVAGGLYFIRHTLRNLLGKSESVPQEPPPDASRPPSGGCNESPAA